MIDLGLSDGVWSEVKSGLVRGQQVIVDENTDDKKRGFRLF